MNEWYAKDMSRKMRSTLKIKSSQGYAIGHPPYGYKYDGIDKKRWAIEQRLFVVYLILENNVKV